MQSVYSTAQADCTGKQISSSSYENNVTHKLFIYELYIYIYIYMGGGQDLILNNPQELVCHKTQPTNQLNES